MNPEKAPYQIFPTNGQDGGYAEKQEKKKSVTSWDWSWWASCQALQMWDFI